ncbi:MAG: CvpA family protein [Erysipelotrichaceae bacterium]|nr:CvpA family protein [Erysipelotrichaceae bacterium]MBR6957120.1 CvpA family protein [Erysipelotrichaceae bacterium]
MYIPENLFPLVNIIMVVWLVIAVIAGYKKGLIWGVLRILGAVASIFIAWILAEGVSSIIYLYPIKLAPFSATSVGDIVYRKLNYYLWFVVIFIICMIILALIRPIFNAITELPVLKEVNGICGALLAIVETFIFFIVITLVLNGALIRNGKDVIENTALRYVEGGAQQLSVLLNNKFSENVAIQKMISDPLSLTEEDIHSIIDWLSRSKVSSDTIREFLTNYGIDVNVINQYLGNN